MKKTALLMLVLLLGILILGGCDGMNPGTGGETAPPEGTDPQIFEEGNGTATLPEEYFLWMAYWNYDGFNQELECFEETPKAVSVFGVLFDEKGDEPFLPPETLELLHNVKMVSKEEDSIYLSFINDLRLADGSFSNKDVALLERLLKEEGRKLHASKIVEIALQSGVDGVEIDYENIKKDESLWEPFAQFLEVLKKQCDENNLKLRVVLGAYDVNKTTFPEGIEYAVMCYNLYGTHSGPGPKADKAFLKETFARCSNLPGEVSAAFSTGGFVWSDGQYERAVTETEAREIYALAEGKVGELLRDEESGAMHFTFEEEGVTKELWYADGETLRQWKAVAKECGIRKFSLWKVGGNSKSSLSAFADK